MSRHRPAAQNQAQAPTKTKTGEPSAQTELPAARREVGRLWCQQPAPESVSGRRKWPAAGLVLSPVQCACGVRSLIRFSTKEVKGGGERPASGMEEAAARQGGEVGSGEPMQTLG